MFGRLHSLPRVSLGRGPSSPRGPAKLRRKPQAPPLGTWEKTGRLGLLPRLQPMMLLPESARELIESGALAHLVTIGRDGSPQVSCVWVGLDGDDIVSGHVGERQKLVNVRRDPRVALSLEGTRIHPPGLKEYLVVHGRARVEEGGAPQLLQRLAHVYLGADVTFPPMEDPPPGYTLRITAERIAGVGPWMP